jgi:hypothetical protein
MRKEVPLGKGLWLVAERRHERQLRGIILVEIIPEKGDVSAFGELYLLKSLS